MTVALVFIDTIILAGKSNPKDMFSSPDGPDSQQAADDEWEWLIRHWPVILNLFPEWDRYLWQAGMK